MRLQPGDVLLLGHEGSPIARSVRILSDSPWNHAAIVGTCGDCVYHCPGETEQAVACTPLSQLPTILSRPGYGHICITAYRGADTAAAARAAGSAHAFFAEQPFDYSMGQNGILGALLWAQQSSDTVSRVLGAVLEQLENVSEDVLSEQATNCTEFVWRCFDEAGGELGIEFPYYDRSDDERTAIVDVPQAEAPHASAPGYRRHKQDTPLNRLAERIVKNGRKPSPKQIGKAINARPAKVSYVLPTSIPDADVIPDLLVPRDFADAAGLTRVATWPATAWQDDQWATY